MSTLIQSPAASASASPDRSGPTQHLTFTLAGEAFAIGILAIKEIIEYRGVTEVPMMPTCVRGVINLRGAVVPVLDLLARFGKPAASIGKRTCIVIIEAALHGERQVIGVMVDAVSEVLDIAADDIEPAPTFGVRIGREFVAGMGKVRGKFVIVLDMERVLAIEDIAELQLNADAEDALLAA